MKMIRIKKKKKKKGWRRRRRDIQKIFERQVLSFKY
jgi:hypothetical protein